MRVDPAQSSQLNVLDGLPRLSLLCGTGDEFGLVAAFNSLGLRIVVGVCDGAEGTVPISASRSR